MARSRARGERELPEAPPQYDIYTALLVVSLAAMLAGLFFVWWDYSSYSEKVPPKKPPASISQPVEQQPAPPAPPAPPP